MTRPGSGLRVRIDPTQPSQPVRTLSGYEGLERLPDQSGPLDRPGQLLRARHQLVVNRNRGPHAYLRESASRVTPVDAPLDAPIVCAESSIGWVGVRVPGLDQWASAVEPAVFRKLLADVVSLRNQVMHFRGNADGSGVNIDSVRHLISWLNFLID